MPLIFQNYIYPDECAVVEIYGHRYLCSPNCFMSFVEEEAPRSIAAEQIPPWARWAQVAVLDEEEFAAEVGISIECAESHAASKEPEAHHDMIDAAIAIADGKVKNTKQAYEEIARTAYLNISKDQPAASYKSACREAAIAKLKRHGLRSGEEM